MDVANYWPKKLTPKKGTKQILRGHKVYYDFDRIDFYKKDESRFPGIQAVREYVDLHIKSDDWSSVEIILTLDDAYTLKHEEKGGKHFFVLNAKLLKDRPYSALRSLLGAAVSATPDVLQLASPEKLRTALLATDPVALLGEIKDSDARALLPIAVQILMQALAKEPAGIAASAPSSEASASAPPSGGNGTPADGQVPPPLTPTPASTTVGATETADLDSGGSDGGGAPDIDLETVSRAMGLILARARDRADISIVLSALDDLDVHKREYFRRNPDVVRVVAEEDITTHEITSWAYRRRQLDVYKELLRGSAESIKAYKEDNDIMQEGEEPAWQFFFEENRWIFGLALDYYMNEGLSPDRLEQTTTGHNFLQNGKRPDALLASVALIRSLCFVEIKTPRKELLGDLYRDDVWGPSVHLAGAVAQSQKTVYQATRSIAEKFHVEDEDGVESGRPIFSVQPRSFVVVGSLGEFLTPEGAVKKRQFASFELYRRNLVCPEVLTFDELYERAERILLGVKERA